MTTSILAGLKAHREQLLSAGSLPDAGAEPAGEPAEPTAAEAPLGEPAEPEAPVAEPDAPGEPEVAAEPDQPAQAEPEIPSGEEPQATADTPDADLQHAFKLAGGDTIQALASTVKRFNQNAATLGREKKKLEDELKELKGKLATPPTAAAAPAPVAAPAPAPAAPAPTPSASAAPETDIDTRVREAMSRDADAWTDAREYREAQDRLGSILAVEKDTGRLIGELPVCVYRLQALKAQTVEGAKALGLTPAPEFEQEEIARRIAELTREERDLKREQTSLRSISAQAKSNLQQRKDAYTRRIESERESAQAEADRTAGQEAEAVTFAADHEREFNSVMSELKMDGPEYETFRANVWNRGLSDLTLNNDARLAAKKDLRAYLRSNAEKERAYLGMHRKAEEVKKAQTARTLNKSEAPKGARAVATPALRSGKPDDWQGKMRADARRIMGGGSA